MAGGFPWLPLKMMRKLRGHWLNLTSFFLWPVHAANGSGYRGFGAGVLPERFWTPNEFGVRGGVESAAHVAVDLQRCRVGAKRRDDELAPRHSSGRKAKGERGRGKGEGGAGGGGLYTNKSYKATGRK